MQKMTSGQLQPGSRACGLAGEQQEAADWDEIFVKDTSDKASLSKTHEEFLKVNKKKKEKLKLKIDQKT